MADILQNMVKHKTEEATRYRVGAAVLDYLIFLAVVFFYLLTFGEKVGANAYRVQGPLALIPFVFWFIYFVVVESIFGGSLGKRTMGLRVVSINDEHLKFTQVLKGRICDVLDIWWCFGLMGFVRITAGGWVGL